MIQNILVFIIGTIFGSFLNVCIYRLPKDKSVILPGSYCPKCKAPIKWYDNIPLLSYILLRGKCRSCSENISLRYPFVEIITGIIFLIFYLRFWVTPDFFKFVFFFCLLVVVSLIDIDYHAIPVYLCIVGICVGLLFSLHDSIILFKSGVLELKKFSIVRDFQGLIFGFGFTYLFKFFGDVLLSVYLSWRKKESIEGETEALGLGDVDFMGMVGVFLGVKSVVLVFFLAPFFALLYSVFAIIFKKSHLIPYLPYLSLATVVTYFWGEKILTYLF
jgi:leader peptidase (prepilin peptidase)/N-methyltransferase